MKREIKFRAWDKSHKTMFYPDDISHITFGHYDWDMIYTATGTPASFGKKYPDEMEIMQFTGLKDKNGKDIYEGDILYREGWWKLKADFVNGKFVVNDLDKIRFTNRIVEIPIYELNGLIEYEIIGNIYENPELL